VRVLLVEDDAGVAGALASGLRRRGWELVHAATGAEAVARAHGVHLVLLDLGLPDMDGMDVCRILRAGSDVPIIALTARGDPRSKVAGLRGGADDYVVKPFGFAELVARMEAVLRRSRPVLPVPAPARPLVRLADVEIDLDARTVRAHGGPVRLTRKEFDLLRYLVEHRGEVITRDRLLDEVWGYEQFPTTRTVDTHVLRLRQKFEPDPERPRHILTVHGQGYRFEA
jgi:DNA-binding response OmpR family regulator